MQSPALCLRLAPRAEAQPCSHGLLTPGLPAARCLGRQCAQPAGCGAKPTCPQRDRAEQRSAFTPAHPRLGAGGIRMKAGAHQHGEAQKQHFELV